MKFIGSTALLLGITATAIGQVSEREMEKHMKEVAKSKEKNSIVWDLDTVYNAGVPCFIMKEKSNGALQPHDFIVTSFAGQELIYVKFHQYTQPGSNPQSPTIIQYYTWYFDDTKSQCETQAPRKVYKDVIENNLVNGNAMNSDAEAKFVTMCGMKYSAAQAANVQPAPAAPVISPQQAAINEPLVNRNRSGGISIILSQINQAGMQIGSEQRNTITQNGAQVEVITIYSINRVMLAQASSVPNAHRWNLVSTRDNISREVDAPDLNDEMAIIKYLIANNYL